MVVAESIDPRRFRSRNGRESGTWLALKASIPDASGQGMQIAVKAKRVLVCATQINNEQNAKQGEEEILLAANLPVEVDPPSAAASFKNHNLLLMIKKAQLSGAVDHLNA